MENKYLNLKNEFLNHIDDGICIAFSGGVDSSLLLKIASDVSKEKNIDIYAVTFSTKLHPMSDITISKKLAKSMNVIHEIITIDEFQNKDILNNPIDRCYQCKKYLFTRLLQFAKSKGLKYIVDGTNADDLKEYRPGLMALSELGIISPLAKFNITKKEVREIATTLNLSVASRPSSPCLATRLPYNTKITLELLQNIEKAEDYLNSIGFKIVRVRVHKDIARIEIPTEDFNRFLQNKDNIITYFKKLGFIYVTLDLEGFRSGSMDIHK